MTRIIQQLRSIMCWTFQIPRFSKAAEHAAAVVGGLRFPVDMISDVYQAPGYLLYVSGLDYPVI